VKRGKHNVGPSHLSRIEFGELDGVVDDQLPDVDLLQVEAILDYQEEDVLF
jgi:hypothetical protein